MITLNGRLPNSTVKFPPEVKALIIRDAQREGHGNMSHIVRRIVMEHYGLIKPVKRFRRA